MIIRIFGRDTLSIESTESTGCVELVILTGSSGSATTDSKTKYDAIG